MTDRAPSGLRQFVPLAPLTTFELGGPARYVQDVGSYRRVKEAVDWARRRHVPVVVLGGGSNVVVADEGFDGLVLRPVFDGLEVEAGGSRLAAGAGVVWDDVVALAVERGLTGIECLAGIPGLAGATPIQNVGAYGQEVARVVEDVTAIDLESLEEQSFSSAECRFGYRTSVFRRNPGRFLVTGVTFRLQKDGKPSPAYDELRRALDAFPGTPGPADVREAVLTLRRRKSMVHDPSDPNRRSAGSFFVNPVLTLQELDGIQKISGETVPTFPLDGGRVKLPAAWLIERAGFCKGMRRGNVGISSAHALALVHHGGGTAAELVSFARDIRDGVKREFGIRLRPEPVFLGFDDPDPLNI